MNYAMPDRVKYDTPDRKGRPENIFGDKGLVVVIGLRGLPGTSQYTCPISETIAIAVDEAKRLYAAGVRCVMVQNVCDSPFHHHVGPDTVAHVTAAAYAVRCALPDDCVMGVSVLRDDGDVLVSVASAVEADFIRPKCYVGAIVGADGISTGCMDEVLDMRYKLKCNVKIVPDIHDRTSTVLGNVPLKEACAQALSAGLADALVLTGVNADASFDMMDEIRAAFPNTYLFLGGGANAGNLRRVYEKANGIFVASCLKDSGNMTGNLSDEKVRLFMEAYNEA